MALNAACPLPNLYNSRLGLLDSWSELAELKTRRVPRAEDRQNRWCFNLEFKLASANANWFKTKRS